MRPRQKIPKGLRNRRFDLTARGGEQFKARRAVDRDHGLVTYLVERRTGEHNPYVLMVPAEDLEALRALIIAVDVEQDERLERKTRKQLQEERPQT